MKEPKMTNDSKNTKPSTIVENKKTQLTEEEQTQLTEEELKKVSGGTLSDPEEGGQVRSRPK
jgi:bacteriocin-like protein